MATSHTFGQFARRMRVRRAEVVRGGDRLVRKQAVRVLQAVAIATPVDTGRARSNWIVTLSVPSSRTRAAFAQGRKLGQGEGANLRATLADGNRVIATRTGTERAIWITNNLDYIADLNRGTSAQAPMMFVETAIKAGSLKPKDRIFRP